MSTAEEQFADLFRGRTDAIGLVHGESRKAEVHQGFYNAHLHEPNASLGIYPMVHQAPNIPHRRQQAGWFVAWGCSDIDDGFESSLPLAVNLHNVLKALGITSWVERTKGKGYHVWVFVDGYCPAADMRHALLFAHQVAGVTATEVNPKQETLDPGQLGNYVNLPYAKDWQGTEKRAVLDLAMVANPDPEGFFSAALRWEWWVEQAHATRNTAEQIATVAALYVPPKPKVAHVIKRYEGGLEVLTRRLDGLAFKIFRDGPLDGRDRSGTLQRLAHLMRERSDLSPSEASALLYDADQRWGKFHEQGRPHYLDKMIDNAY